MSEWDEWRARWAAEQARDAVGEATSAIGELKLDQELATGQILRFLNNEHEHMTRGIIGLSREVAVIRAMVSALSEALIAKGVVDLSLIHI